MRYREKEKYDILLVEDNSGDVLLTREAFVELNSPHNLHLANDGEDALNFLFKRANHTKVVTPDLILLDLNLPNIDGREVLKEIKGHKDTKKIPVVVLTTSEAESDVRMCYDLHANCYLTKPVDFEEFLKKIELMLNFWTKKVKLPD